MKYGSPSFQILVDGYDLTPVLIESSSQSVENLTQMTAPFGTSSEGHSPIGIARGALNVAGGIFDQAVDPLHAGKIPDGGVGVSRVVCLFNEGQAKAKHFTGYEGAYSQKSEALATDGQLTKANVGYLPSGQVDDGVILQELVAKTADWDTTATPVDAADDPGNRHIDIVSSSVANPSVITTLGHHHLATGDVVAIFTHTSVAPDINDNPAAAETWKLIGHTVTVTGDHTFTIPVNVTDGGLGGYCVLVSRASGGYGYQQVTARTGVTAFIGTIKHSVDGSTWADLIVFTDTGASAHAKERKATATATTQVRRYLAFDGNGTTFGSLTVFAGFARGA